MRTRRKKDKIVLQTVNNLPTDQEIKSGQSGGSISFIGHSSEKAKFATLAFHLMNRQLLQNSQ